MRQAVVVLDNQFLCTELASQMRSRESFTAITFVIVASFSLSACHKRVAAEQSKTVEVIIPERGAYTGAFMDFGDEEDDVTLEIIEDFEQMVGKHQAIIA